MPPAHRWLTLLTCLALLGACTADDTAEAPTSPDESGAGTTDPAEEESEAVALPDTPLGAQLQWVLDVLADGAPEEDQAIAEHFAETFLAEVPVSQLRQVFQQFAADWTVTAFQGSPDGTDGVATITEPGGSEFELVGIVEPEPPHRFTGLLFRPPVEEIEPPDDFEELADRLADTAPTTAVLAAEVSDGECQAIFASEADATVPIGSIFKLYVLGAVADAVAAGELTWDDTVTVTDELRSLPSGRLQEEPTGTEVTVRDAAQAMIEISDNTATDLLIHLVGRAEVEAAQADLGHHDPSLNTPFLTTRELFQLKWQIDEAERDAYLAAPAEERRAFLDDDLATRPLDVDVAAISGPTAVETLEWFATAEDVCRTQVALAEMGHREVTAPVRDILAANPGVAIDEETWSYVGFKGGSEPGVLAMSWYLEAADAEYVLVTAAVDPDAPLDELTLLQLMASGIDLLAQR